MMVGVLHWEIGSRVHVVLCVSAIIGESLNENCLLNLGTSVLKVERRFNEAVGFTRKDDRLARFFRKEKLLPRGNVLDVPEEEIHSANKF
jgi:aldehyde:ferredoxin oxidoreductase